MMQSYGYTEIITTQNNWLTLQKNFKPHAQHSMLSVMSFLDEQPIEKLERIMKVTTLMPIRVNIIHIH